MDYPAEASGITALTESSGGDNLTASRTHDHSSLVAHTLNNRSLKA
jgi:hypothetical protein